MASYNPAQSRTLKIEYVKDASRSGCPKEVIEEKKQELLNHIQKNCKNREKSSKELGWLIGVSARTAYPILHKAGMTKQKPTWKPELMQEKLDFSLH